MKYKVQGVSVATTKENKPYKKLDLVTQAGETFKSVPYWSSYPEYEAITIGSYIEGAVESTQNGKWTNHKLLLANAPTSPKRYGGNNAAIAQAQDKKAQNIDAAQSRNEVMWAKNNAAMLIAHHPAYKDLNNLNLSHAFKNLMMMIYNSNPESSLDAQETDDNMSTKIAMQVDAFEALPDDSDEINPDSIPF